MEILNDKNNKNGLIIDLENYEEFLKFEILEHTANKISSLLNKNEVQKAIEYVENHIDQKLEIPLILNNNLGINDNLNELIINEKAKFINFFVVLKKELLSCKKFYFIVSFIKFSGIQLLINILEELEKKGIEGEIITSVYLNITDVKALQILQRYKNIKVKIYNNSLESFHTKAYLFEKEKYSTCIIGSSNLSQSALYSAEEWNVKLTNNNFFQIYDKSMKQFKLLWNSNEAIKLNDDFIQKYDEYKKKNIQQNTFDYKKIINDKYNEFKPNTMQKEILEKLKITREHGQTKGLVVAATGTGKTYLAALDIKNYFSKNDKEFKVLFVAHREELLENGMTVLSNILKINKNNFGICFGGIKDIDKKIIFASIQTLRTEYKNFKQDYFDYIVVDEFHHASADSYIKVINYFNPKFLLGLTATPERMDGKNILALCNYNLVGEIGLKKAMEQDLIAPFHYFGINDSTIDYNKISYKNGKYDESELTQNLNKNRRTDYILDKINKFGFCGDCLSAVAFCENIEHANFMNKQFKRVGYKSKVLTSKTNMTERSNLLNDFKNKKIEILCVVDIFNEGIDIPNINLLLFLRPTLSSTIFIQQIGRGLRKYKNKDFVTIIDFIGNHKKDYLITKIFSEKIQGKNYIYDKKEKIINEIKNQFSNIPGASYIELDRICQERIIKKIEKINFNSKKILKDLYDEYKIEIGKNIDDYLEIIDFNTNITLFKELCSKLGSFYEAQLLFEENHFKKSNSLNSKEISFLAYLEKKITLNEPFTYLIVKILSEQFNKKSSNLYVNSNILIEEFYNYYKTNFDKKYLIERIFLELVEDNILQQNLYGYTISNTYISIFKEKNSIFYNRLNSLLILGLNEFKNNNLEEFNENILLTHKEYMRIDLQILLDSKVPKGTWRAGYANTDKDICLFITNDKSHISQENLKYDNSLYADNIIQWISQPKTYHTSNVGEMFIKHREKGYKVHIFARKFAFMNGNKTNPFIYLGNADYYSSFGDKPMKILWKLKHKIPQEIIQELYKLNDD